MIVTIEEDKCVAGGQCVVAAPEVFDQRDDDGVVVLLQKKPPVEEFERVRTAATMCPAAAIRLAESLPS